jgi:CRISPR/Cas system CMR-associated protein Cmr5 small subunit
VKNIEQIRAANAIECAHTLDRQAVRKIPALVLANGLLAAASFSLDSESRRNMRTIWAAIGNHLHERGHLKTAPSGADDNAKVRSVLKDLAGRSSLELQNATTEALAYMGYLKRFTSKPAGEADDAED